MPTLTIYLPKDLFKKIENNPSKLIQEALRKVYK